MIEHIVVSGSVITKPLLGLLISLGIENYVSMVDAVYLYNLISVSIILFIAAMSGPRSETAFCIVVPMFAGIFEWFGWLRATDPITHMPSSTAQMGLVGLTVIMGLLGVMLYMNEQNKTNYGTLGPGSKLQNIALYIIFFNVALTMVSGFSVIPLGSTQPMAGACAVGFQCDSSGNFDFTTTSNSLKASSGGGNPIIDAAGIFANALGALAIIGINILVGIFILPLVLNNVVGGIYPWLITTSYWTVMMVGLEVMIIVIYWLGIRGWISNAPGDAL